MKEQDPFKSEAEYIVFLNLRKNIQKRLDRFNDLLVEHEVSISPNSVIFKDGKQMTSEEFQAFIEPLM